MHRLDILFKTHDSNVIVPLLEQLVRGDLGSNEELAYRVVGAEGAKPSLRSFIADMPLVSFGGQPATLFTVEFELPGSRRAWLSTSLLREARAAYLGSLRYVIAIDRPLAREISLVKGKLLRSPRFEGSEVAQKLNAVPGLAKRTDKVLRPWVMVVGKLSVEPSFRIKASGDGTYLFIQTLAIRPPWRRYSETANATTNAGEILQLAAAIEAAI